MNFSKLRALGYSHYFNLYIGQLERDDYKDEYIPQWTGKFGNQTAEEILKAAFEYDYSDVQVYDG